MRQAEREITDQKELEAIIREAPVCRLAFFDRDYPYIVPMNFGYAEGCLFFHCAPEGKKLALISRDNRVGFELETKVRVEAHQEMACRWSCQYRSVIGFGRAEIIKTPEEKRRALDIVMAHYAGEKARKYPEEHLAKMVVIKVEIENMTGKQSKNYLNNQASK